MANATIYDVSELAQVSIATVSRVLNSPDQVSEDTRARVITAIDELGFVPKFEAITRARKAVGRIGILTPSFTSDSFVERLRGLVTALSGTLYEPVIYNIDSRAQRDGYLTKLPMTRRVDGLIAIDLPIDEAAVARLIKYKLPIVQIVPSSQSHVSRHLTTIIHNDKEGGRIAAEYLLAKGHRQLGYIGDTGQPEYLGTFTDQKLDSFRQTLALNGVALPDDYVQLGPFGMESAWQLTHRLLQMPSPPTAIFAGSDTQAIGALQAVRESGRKVPDDVAVMGFDDITVSAYMGLTTIHQQLQESGQLALNLLLEQIEQGIRVEAQSISLPFTLMARDTA
ncbi:MAG: LacI family DNA-binding transcriptional regulator [Chloroflexi bacterium]|nr:LacI family DNA-binding transcriptional regulator [Chloroflexota bacterium]MBP8059557.1 LacI family DNA-binding transcriptional regulator [Chloroflexota bacterium]